MRIVRTKAELRELLAGERREERSIGLVPTMGWLHEGHLSLIRTAREACDEVVRVPIYGHAESLNLAMAATVCLYASAEARRR